MGAPCGYKYVIASREVVPHTNAGLPDVECTALPGLSILDAPAIVTDEGLLGGHVGLLGDQHPVVVLEVVVDLSPGEHVVSDLQVFRDIQQVRVLVVSCLSLVQTWDYLRGYEKGIIIKLSLRKLSIPLCTSSLLRYPTNWRRLPILHCLLLIMHLLLHLHQTVIILLKLFIFRETLLVLHHSHQVEGVDPRGEVATPQNSLVVRDQGGVVRGEGSRL
jgi:hypothetical protein